MKYYEDENGDWAWESLSLEELIKHEAEVDSHEGTFIGDGDDFDENEDGWSLASHQYYHADLLDYIEMRKEDGEVE